MKKLLLVTSLVGLNASALSLESLFGSITQHFSNYNNAGSHFKTKLNNSGTLIFNPMYGIKVMNETPNTYNSVTLFVGNNSVGRLLVGGNYSIGAKLLKEHVYIGGALGMYGQSDSGFKQSGVIIKHVPKVGDTSLIPLVGAEMSFKLRLTNTMYLKQNNIVTPLLYTGNLSIGWDL